MTQIKSLKQNGRINSLKQKGKIASLKQRGRIERLEENPIYITFVIHFDPLTAPGGYVSEASYQEQRDNVAWLSGYLDQLESTLGLAYVPKLTLELAGDHAEYYRQDPAGLALLKHLYAQGHALGIHFHKNYRAGAHYWPIAPEDTPAWRQRVTADHINEVDALVAQIIGDSDPAAIRKSCYIITGQDLWVAEAQTRGFSVFTGGRNEALNLYFDHDVYNPWRPAMGPGTWVLDEDLASDWILIPQPPDLGDIGEHSNIPPGVPPEYFEGMDWGVWQDLSIPAMKRKFWQTYLEWRQNPQKIWVFGWTEHPYNLFADDGAYGATANYRDEVVEFVIWLNQNIMNRLTPDGRLIAEYATVQRAMANFQTWEADHPGESSFAYPTVDRDYDLYPYYYKGLTPELMYAHWDAEINTWQAQGVKAIKLLQAAGRTWEYQSGQIVNTGSTTIIYLLWSESGEQIIDFSSIIPGQVTCVAGRDGVQSIQPAEALKVTAEPTIVTE